MRVRGVFFLWPPVVRVYNAERICHVDHSEYNTQHFQWFIACVCECECVLCTMMTMTTCKNFFSSARPLSVRSIYLVVLYIYISTFLLALFSPFLSPSVVSYQLDSWCSTCRFESRRASTVKRYFIPTSKHFLKWVR